MVKTKGKKARIEGPLDTSASHLLHRVLQLASDIYAEETGPDAPTQRQFAVLTAVSANEGLTQTDLVKATGIDRSTLADLVARMITKGLLERERSTADARAKAVRLTDAGRAALTGSQSKVASADKRILGHLPGGKRDSFVKILRTFAHAGEERLHKAAKKLAKAEKKALKALKEPKEPKAVKEPKAAKPEKAPKVAKAAKAPKPAKVKDLEPVG
jgi:DNA-binding MarR family transcriptional regulator